MFYCLFLCFDFSSIGIFDCFLSDSFSENRTQIKRSIPSINCFYFVFLINCFYFVFLIVHNTSISFSDFLTVLSKFTDICVIADFEAIKHLFQIVFVILTLPEVVIITDVVIRQLVAFQSLPWWTYSYLPKLGLCGTAFQDVIEGFVNHQDSVFQGNCFNCFKGQLELSVMFCVKINSIFNYSHVCLCFILLS